jgi:hypothetical protein
MADNFDVVVQQIDAFTTTVETTNVSNVTAIGIQGLPGSSGSLSSVSDVDATNLNNGSVLVYKTTTNKWTSTTTLDAQNMEGGEF